MRSRFFHFAPLLGAFFVASCSLPAPAQTPLPTLDAGAQKIDANLQAQINAAIQSGQKKLILAPGTYRVAPPAPNKPHLLVDGAKNLEIVANGVTLVCTSLNRALGFRNCQNVSLAGLTVDYDPLAWTQGTVVSLAKDKKSCEVRLDAGYKTLTGVGPMIIFEPHGIRPKPDTWTRYGARFEAGADARTIRVSWGNPVNDALAVGDKATLRGAVLSAHGIVLDGCSNMTLQGVTLFSSTSFGFYESSGDANRYLNCRVTPGPIPPGATAPRLLSTPADGFHSKYAKRGPIVENCLFDRMGDDGIAINGDYAAVAGSQGNQLFFVPRRADIIFQVGDRICITKPDGTVGGEAKIIALTRLVERDGEIKALRTANYASLQNEMEFNTMWQAQTDEPLPAIAGDLLSSPDRNGDGFILRGNTVKITRSRGVLLKASDGLVEGNTVDSVAMGAIVLCPEPDQWMEAGFSHNVVIRGNTLKGTGYAASNLDQVQAGAISITAPQAGRGAAPSFAPAGGQRDIIVEGNSLDGVRGVNLLITSAQGVVVRNNRFLNTHQAPDLTGSRRGVDNRSVIFIANARDIKLEANTVSQMGAEGKTLVKIGPNAQKVSGAETQVKVTP